jgi:hypothetical protein
VRPLHLCTSAALRFDRGMLEAGLCCTLQYESLFGFLLLNEKALVNFENHQLDNREKTNEESFRFSVRFRAR